MSTRLFALALTALTLPACTKPEFQIPREVVYLDQGERWGARERAIFYYTPQGTSLHGLRYAWFQHLEGANGRLAAPENLARFGFLYAPEQLDPNFDGGDLNPGNFPVGFAKQRDAQTGEAMLDVTCAACHTGQLEYDGLALRVDGGQPMHAFAWIKPGQLVLDIVSALQTTYLNPFKFDRFAERVLGTRYPDAKPELKKQLAEAIAGFEQEAATTFDLYVDHGYGRMDALGRIADTVFGADVDTSNQKITDAPVSFPHLWDIWKFDWVQWNGVVGQPLGRNIGEALGVKAKVALLDEHGNPLPKSQRYESAVLPREAACLESTLWWLAAPRWPEGVFPPINTQRVADGRALFQQHCRGCHGPHVYPDAPSAPYAERLRYDCEVGEHDQKPSPDKPVEWKMCIKPVWDIGTDPKAADNFVDARYDVSALDPSNPQLRDFSAAEGLQLMIDKVMTRKLDDLRIPSDERPALEGFGRKNEFREMRGYKSRPLHGVWATPPFLHNGSVRTIYQLLSPQPERDTTVWVGTRQYDPRELGYTNERLDWSYELDVRHEGDHNTGHQFTDAGGVGVIGPALTHDERMALIEYIKALGNPAHDPDYAAYAAPMALLPKGACDHPDLQGPASNPALRWPVR